MASRRRPQVEAPTMSERARLAGLTTYSTHGSGHMARIGAAGQDALSRRIAAEYGIPEDAPDYLARVAAARRLWMARVRQGGAGTGTTQGRRRSRPRVLTS